MNFKHVVTILGASMFMSAFAFAEPNTGAQQSKESKATELQNLATWLGGKSLSCTNPRGAEVLNVIFNGATSVSVKANYGSASFDHTDVTQLQVGEVISLTVTGPDSDEGGAIVLIPSYFGDESCVDAHAVTFDEVIGSGKNWGKLRALQCCLK